MSMLSDAEGSSGTIRGQRIKTLPSGSLRG